MSLDNAVEYKVYYVIMYLVSQNYDTQHK